MLHYNIAFCRARYRAAACAGRSASHSRPMTRIRSRPRPAHAADIRRAKAKDLDALAELECRVFTTDRLSRRSFRRLSASKSAALLVAAHEERLVGYGLLLFRRGGGVARLYSIA